MNAKYLSDDELLRRLEAATAQLPMDDRVATLRLIKQRFLQENNDKAATLAEQFIQTLTKCQVIEMTMWLDRKDLPAGEVTCQRSGERSFMASRMEEDGSRGEQKEFRLCSLCAEGPGDGLRGDA
jgi:AcrR family transcriptional regulator